MDFFTQGQIQSDISRIEMILNCGVFNLESNLHIMRKSASTELMICLHDLLQKCNAENVRITFTDHMDVTSDISDITDLVAKIRNAVCHITSELHMASDNVRFSFNVAYGQVNVAQIGDIKLKSDFPDDVAFFFGTLRIYLKRHIIRAFLEAKSNLSPLIKQSP